jgi:Concanavalin A-like lectin/glucanases superfamily
MPRTLLRRTRSVILAVLALLALPAAASASTVSLWHMDEPAGATTMKDSVGTNNGTLTNVTTGVPGFTNTAFSFNGSSSIAVVNSSSSLNPGSGSFTVSAHVNFGAPPTAAIGDFDLVRKGLSSTTGGYWKMEILQTGKAFCQAQGSSAGGSITAGPVLSDNQWHTISCVKRSSALRLVVDGHTFSKTVTLGKISNTAKLTMGAKSVGGDWYNGLMDEVSFSRP